MKRAEIVKADKVLKFGQRAQVSLMDDTRFYNSRIEDIKDNYMVLAMPIDDKHRPLIPEPGTNVICKVIDERCFYIFRAVFMDKGIENIPVWYISRPAEVEKAQHREFVRVKTSQPVVVRPVNAEGALEPMEITYTVDISGGGICIAFKRPLPVDSKVAIELDDIPNIGLLQLMCRVARCAEIDVNGEKVYHIGTEFLSIDRNTQNRLVKFIFDLQRRGLAKGIEKV
ncbi:type IV pilus assembly PilZ [Anaerovibrio sp. JC8]|uniref:flagellar brake protein n=1 Tax=Anaerovibrio sp. JC8 TaxID=1240085 RepID=UPI000A0D2F2B|nr:flagellar brake domain-containing protein [Anaerovibrio sp. JC8]ORU00384.1 type IV pilus assembly PilZ [Anaerovibrio sp. JC8]